MPNPDFSYQGWNPGAGLTDYAQIMRQGMIDQQALRNEQFKNLLEAQQHEALYGPTSGRQIVDQEVATPETVLSGAQELANIGNKNRVTAPIYDARTGTSVSAGPVSSSSPPPTARGPQAKLAQAGVADAQSPSDLHNDEAEPGVQSDGSFVAKSGAVIPADTYRHVLQNGGEVDEDTGTITAPNYVAHNWIQNHFKGQAALAALGSRMLGTSMNVIRPDIIQPDRTRAAPARAPQLSPDEKIAQNQYNQAVKLVSGLGSISVDPAIKAQAQQVINQYNAQVGQRASQPAKQPAQQGGYTKAQVENAVQGYMKKHNTDEATARGVVTSYYGNGQ